MADTRGSSHQSNKLCTRTGESTALGKLICCQGLGIMWESGGLRISCGDVLTFRAVQELLLDNLVLANQCPSRVSWASTRDSWFCFTRSETSRLTVTRSDTDITSVEAPDGLLSS